MCENIRCSSNAKDYPMEFHISHNISIHTQEYKIYLVSVIDNSMLKTAWLTCKYRTLMLGQYQNFCLYWHSILDEY